MAEVPKFNLKNRQLYEPKTATNTIVVDDPLQGKMNVHVFQHDYMSIMENAANREGAEILNNKITK